MVGNGECNIDEECQLNIDEYANELLDVLGLYMKSSSGYEAFKSSNLRIMPLSSRLKQIKSNMNVHEGICLKIYADFNYDFVSKKQQNTVQ